MWSVPKLVRRKVLEGAVRASADWQREAIREAYASKDSDWRLTAVFAMVHVNGFEKQILESLEDSDARIRGHAVEAAGTWKIEAAWPHVLHLLEDRKTPKDLLMYAIEAAGNMRPKEAGELLVDFASSEDEDIADVAMEAIENAEMAVGFEDDDEEEEDDDPWGELKKARATRSRKGAKYRKGRKERQKRRSAKFGFLPIRLPGRSMQPNLVSIRPATAEVVSESLDREFYVTLLDQLMTECTADRERNIVLWNQGRRESRGTRRRRCCRGIGAPTGFGAHG